MGRAVRPHQHKGWLLFLHHQQHPPHALGTRLDLQLALVGGGLPQFLLGLPLPGQKAHHKDQRQQKQQGQPQAAPKKSGA